MIWINKTPAGGVKKEQQSRLSLLSSTQNQHRWLYKNTACLTDGFLFLHLSLYKFAFDYHLLLKTDGTAERATKITIHSSRSNHILRKDNASTHELVTMGRPHEETQPCQVEDAQG